MADKQLVLNQEDVGSLRLCLNYIKRIRKLAGDVSEDRAGEEIKTQCNNLQSKIMDIVDGA